MLKGLLLSGGVAVVWGLVALGALRRHPPAPLNLMVASFAPAIPTFYLAYALTPPALGFLPPPLAGTPAPLGMLDGFLALVLFFLTGVQFYYHVHNSITLRLLAEFTRAPQKSATLAHLEATCGPAALLDERLRALEHARLIRRRGDRLQPTAPGRLAAAVARMTRAVIRLNP